MGSLSWIFGDALPQVIHNAYLKLGIRISLASRLLIELGRLGEVLRKSLTCFIKKCQLELGRKMALIRSFLKPGSGLGGIFGDTLSFEIQARQLNLRVHVVFL